MLTRNEKMLCADALNGTVILSDHDHDYMRMLIGVHPQPEGTCSGLYAEIADAIHLNHLDEKWQVDRKQLLGKLREMPVDDREQLLRTIHDVWQRCDGNFERDLEALSV